MSIFQDAQNFFKAYQEKGDIRNLRNCLDNLDEIIDNADADSQKAIEFKKTIERHIEKQNKDIFIRCNIGGFIKDLKNIDDQDILIDKLAEALSASFSKEDWELFSELLDIKSDYFKRGI